MIDPLAYVLYDKVVRDAREAGAVVTQPAYDASLAATGRAPRPRRARTALTLLRPARA